MKNLVALAPRAGARSSHAATCFSAIIESSLHGTAQLGVGVARAWLGRNMAASENPFSFKAFVNRREKESDDGDIINIGKQTKALGKTRGGKKSPSRAAQLSEDVLFPEALGYSSSKSEPSL